MMLEVYVGPVPHVAESSAKGSELPKRICAGGKHFCPERGGWGSRVVERAFGESPVIQRALSCARAPADIRESDMFFFFVALFWGVVLAHQMLEFVQ